MRTRGTGHQRYTAKCGSGRRVPATFAVGFRTLPVAVKGENALLSWNLYPHYGRQGLWIAPFFSKRPGRPSNLNIQFWKKNIYHPPAGKDSGGENKATPVLFMPMINNVRATLFSYPGGRRHFPFLFSLFSAGSICDDEISISCGSAFPRSGEHGHRGYLVSRRAFFPIFFYHTNPISLFTTRKSKKRAPFR